jgi:type I restriction enzyme S subunit
MDNIQYITEQDYIKINNRSKVETGDILFAMIGTIGNPVVIYNDVNFAIKNVALFKKSKLIISEFIKYFLDAPYVQNKMQNEAKGTTQKFVGLGYLRNFPINLPTLLEQEKIVEEIEKRFTKADIMEKAIDESLEQAKQLKQSILKKAFEGSLVPQDPNDEPASVLLERIKAEKSTSTKKGKK